MRVEDFASTLRERLADTNQSPHGAATSKGLPQDAIRSVLDGHVPRLDRVIEICQALDLEIYIGKRQSRERSINVDAILDDIRKRDDALLGGIRAILAKLA